METETISVKHEQISHQEPGKSEGQFFGDKVERPFPCEICGKSFKEKRTLSLHIASHRNAKEYRCNVCSKDFNRKYSVYMHFTTMHPDHDYHEEQDVRPKEPPDSPFLYTCSVCGKELDPSQFRKHKRLHNEVMLINDESTEDENSNDDEMGSADIDNSVEGEEGAKSSVPSDDVPKSNLSKGRVITPGVIVFRCSICNHRCRSLYTIQNHLRTHTGEKPFHCPVEGCGKTFCDPQGLRNHERVTHSDKRPYVCEFCGKSYKRRIYLTEHEIYHDPEAPRNFLCHLCDKSFRTRKNFAQHLKTHKNAVDQYKCNLCPRSFKHQRILKIHITSKHSDLSTPPDNVDYKTTPN